MGIDEKLRRETEKWLKKIGDERKKIVLVDASRKSMIDDIDAYISDSQHFLNKNDLIRAFEAVVWSWAILEIGLELGVLKKS
ncbi:DUF357 domain-containing protein [Candidatus Woesearchaeota archaeon]|nr:DUF357 domain-containing protein [Candidatus Woesearchaeota archaeon]